jgi:hypothetical protein
VIAQQIATILTSDHADHPSRRRAVVALLSGTLGTLGLKDSAAKKKHKRKKSKKKPPRCTEACGSDCYYCFMRSEAPALCGDGSLTSCAESCTSDQDCLEHSPDQPYCVRQRVVRATGEVEDVGEPVGVTHGCCIAIFPCQ